MIHRSGGAVQPNNWKSDLANVVTDLAELLRLTGNQAGDFPPGLLPQSRFPLRVPRRYVNRIERGNPQDPLLLQVLPSAKELIEIQGYVEDPLAEAQTNPRSGIIHKYHGRVLLVSAGACAINCRYCFRRHFPYQENRLGPRQWQHALSYISENPSIEEVILSGGDPLVNGNRKLSNLCSEIAAIAHVKRLRIHTRLPIVIPARIDDGFIDWVTASKLKVIMVIHANHAAELDDDVAGAMLKLSSRGVTLLNQSVLLKGVNDNCDTLVALSQRLFEITVLPYYLHLLDKVAGASHFDVSEQRAQQLAAAMAARLPGYLVPRLAREETGKAAKVLIPVNV